ncbi:MAG: type II toxin-antitoxin system VapC family toxin [Dehalococcoidales bacterium]|nr:type II toxin-antitoxin system VapC family toxin [Dehalococcoidales bacterium]
MVFDVYLLDTNVASIVWDTIHPNHSSIFKKFKKLPDDRVVICSVTNAEIEFGLRSTSNPNDEKQQIVRDNMNTYFPVQIDVHTAENYGQIKANLFSKFWPKHKKKPRYIEEMVDEVTGKSLGIQENDLWIVSVAVQYNYIFITTDKAGGMKRIVEAANYADRTEFWEFN